MIKWICMIVAIAIVAFVMLLGLLDSWSMDCSSQIIAVKLVEIEPEHQERNERTGTVYYTPQRCIYECTDTKERIQSRYRFGQVGESFAINRRALR